LRAAGAIVFRTDNPAEQRMRAQERKNCGVIELGRHQLRLAPDAQADVGVLVISARKGEFETGFDKGGQTREHAVLAKMQGINKLIVVINKMDDPTVEWSKERFVPAIRSS